ncbi:hypothetical protein DY124_06070 [Apilactobacillus micheneri]|uniref:hypothetical protein n=1 Tax=Apilactobacillus micheneri TaxID=1899430 RepID=UPI00112E9C1D|nr:hypothetical protein [Apilactobacillus micheneri]TPR43140.1 hypothetical protein DY124_06070 [Apilactobacillus micheneri]TPR47228.1 hypothetical protein DY125_06565 [Apilactobacillus micheneri]
MKYYVQKQDNSQYLADVSLEQKEGFTEVYPNNDQVVKLMNFTDKCFLTNDNLLVVPDQVPMSEQEQDRQKMLNQINDLQSENNTLKSQLDNSDKDAKDKQKQIDDLNNRIGQLMLAIAKQPQGGNK